MTLKNDLLVLTASNGENLKLARGFVELSTELGANPKLVDLTKFDLPLYNPRTHASNGIPPLVTELNKSIASIPRWIICSPEYNGSIPPVLTSAIAWLSVQGDDFRNLFNGRPIAMASFSGGGGLEMLLSLRIQLTHLGAQVVGRQLMSSSKKPPENKSMKDLLIRLMQMQPLKL